MDLVEVFAAWHGYHGNVPFPSNDELHAAMVEARRRARVERRRDKFLFANPGMREAHECGHEMHWVVFHVVGMYPKTPRVGAPDYWTACDGALDDVGAPKESE